MQSFAFGTGQRRHAAVFTLNIVHWASAVTLTIFLLSFTISLRPSGEKIQALQAIPDLGLFILVFNLWFGALVSLLIRRMHHHQQQRDYAHLIVLGMLALVYWGFWTIHLPEGQSEELGFLALGTSLSLGGGRLNDLPPNLLRYGFPGLGFLTAVTSTVLRLSSIATRTILLILSALVIVITTYRLYEKSIATPERRSASIAVLVTVVGSMYMAVSFFYRPDTVLSIPLFLCMLTLPPFTGPAKTGDRRSSLLVVLLFSAVVITHFVTALASLAVLLGTSWINRRMGKKVAHLPLLLVLSVLLAVWLVYYSVSVVSSAVSVIGRVRELLSRGEFLAYARTLMVANVGPEVPLWARFVRTIWLFLIYVVGFAVAILKLMKLHTLAEGEAKLSAGLVALAGLAVGLTLLSGTGDQVGRFLQFGVFFAAPLVVSAAWRKPSRGIRAAAVCLGLLVLPTFLAFNGEVSLRAFYPGERHAASFLASRSGAEAPPKIFTGGREINLLDSYLPRAEFQILPRVAEDPAVSGRSAVDEFWRKTDFLVSSFLSVPPGRAAFFVFSRVLPYTYEHLLGIPGDDSGWENLLRRLEEADLFYQNGFSRLYATNPAGRP